MAWSPPGVRIPAGWHPGMYDDLFRLPPSDVALLTVPRNRAKVPLADAEVFVTIMPFDDHGEKVGRKLYPMSQEVAIARAPAAQRITRPSTAAATRAGSMRAMAAE